MELMIIGLDSRQEGEAALRRMEGASDDLAIPLRDLALVTRNESGRPKILHSADVGVGEPNLRGVRLGLLVGLAEGGYPLGSAPSSATVGGVLAGIVAGVGKDAVDNEMMRTLAAALGQNEAVLLALGEAADIAALETLTNGQGGFGDSVVTAVVPPAVQSLLTEVSMLSIDDLENTSVPCMS